MFVAAAYRQAAAHWRSDDVVAGSSLRFDAAEKRLVRACADDRGDG